MGNLCELLARAPLIEKEQGLALSNVMMYYITLPQPILSIIYIYSRILCMDGLNPIFNLDHAEKFEVKPPKTGIVIGW